MHHPEKPRKRKKGRALEPPRPTSLKDRLTIWAWIVGVLLVFGLGFHFLTTRHQQASLDAEVQRWRSDYHLNEGQARRIRAMEVEFHGNGNPFFRPAHTQGETREHHRAMAGVMNPEDGERFFKAQEGAHQAKLNP